MRRPVFIMHGMILAMACALLAARAHAFADEYDGISALEEQLPEPQPDPLPQQATEFFPFAASSAPTAKPFEAADFDDDTNNSWLAGYEQTTSHSDTAELDLELNAAPLDDFPWEEGIVYLGDGPPPAYSFGYNRVRSAMTWLPGHDDRFGWFSYESFANAQVNEWPSLVSGFGVHFLDGPVQTDMPPRLFDFVIGVADRRLIRPNIGYDIVFRVGAFSDFEGSAEDGVRYPSHAVTFFRFNKRVELVLGIDYLDRDDISLLPVAGVIWRPADWLRVEAVFPRPRVATRIMDTKQWIYLGGELGGGTWAVERVGFVDDNATYSDLRLLFGWEAVSEGLSSSLEIGYVFDRELGYRSAVGDYNPPGGFMVRTTARY